MKKQVLPTIILILAVSLVPTTIRAAMNNETTATDTCGCAGPDGAGSFRMLPTLRASGEAMKITKVSMSQTGEAFIYNGIIIAYVKAPYYDGTELKNPVQFNIDRTNTGSVKVKYSLYTFKQQFLKDNGAYRLYELQSCGVSNFPLQTCC